MSFPINMTGFMQKPKGFPTDGLVAYWKLDGNYVDGWSGIHNGSSGGLIQCLRK